VILFFQISRPVPDSGARKFAVFGRVSGQTGEIPPRRVGPANDDESDALSGPERKGFCWAKQSVFISGFDGTHNQFSSTCCAWTRRAWHEVAVWAQLRGRVSRASEQLSDEIRGIDVIAGASGDDAFVERVEQFFPFACVQVVTTLADRGIQGHELNDLTLGQVGGLVQDEPPSTNMGFERLHRLESYVAVQVLATSRATRSSGALGSASSRAPSSGPS
jgi:hypothetical protein